MSTFDDLVAALNSSDTETRVTSVRQSRSLSAAVTAAVELGWAPNGNEGVNASLRESLEAFARDLALEQHFERYPEARPSLGEVAVALAELEHNPLADDPELVLRAAAEIVQVKPDADPDDVLVWALSLRVRARTA